MPEIAEGLPRFETAAELQAALAIIVKWEKEQNKLMIWDRITRLPFKLLDKITPKVIHEKLGKLLDELGSYIQNGGNYLVAGRKVGSLLESSSRAAGEARRDRFRSLLWMKPH